MENMKESVHFANLNASFLRWLDAIHNLSMKRQEELINCANRRRLGQLVQGNHEESDVLVLANALHKLASLTGKARTSLWCCHQLSNQSSTNKLQVQTSLGVDKQEQI